MVSCTETVAACSGVYQCLDRGWIPFMMSVFVPEGGGKKTKKKNPPFVCVCFWWCDSPARRSGSLWRDEVIDDQVKGHRATALKAADLKLNEGGTLSQLTPISAFPLAATFNPSCAVSSWLLSLITHSWGLLSLPRWDEGLTNALWNVQNLR